MKELLPRLEKKEGVRLFIPERDLEVGVQAYDSQLVHMIQTLAICFKVVMT